MFLMKPKAQARYDVCKACPSFVSSMSKCSECGCFMKVKVKIAASVCPLEKW
jgi:hypothetical protein